MKRACLPGARVTLIRGSFDARVTRLWCSPRAGLAHESAARAALR
ncbi:hypothetical protein BMA10247_A0408 [Burkholderia mallei NCTC 10247]|uniref:Uncharacterized protein n=1 Tax=Burkholderia pseudomallei 1710a TaxID=320371 RepID=A0A0E1VQP3_BURPE|nr:hypothetical protein BMASAVP1_1558 [Burkholderia mallei SAVP1]ABO02449.1 hypothetical protein BMA10247_A0408 [Burkholderia mallei NCTC 10247]EEH29897.1 conserved hypothetical protein [Burkholderia pseudomallei Pakistan 9]EEP50648.1 conserved hypothetical protein [Burkholderia pseudomallei MSHR346]EET03158.1 hypothetical protein BURPS1710A_A2168 [Burkholderia pseudomallei 1710a]